MGHSDIAGFFLINYRNTRILHAYIYTPMENILICTVRYLFKKYLYYTNL